MLKCPKRTAKFTSHVAFGAQITADCLPLFVTLHPIIFDQSSMIYVLRLAEKSYKFEEATGCSVNKYALYIETQHWKLKRPDILQQNYFS